MNDEDDELTSTGRLNNRDFWAEALSNAQSMSRRLREPSPVMVVTTPEGVVRLNMDHIRPRGNPISILDGGIRQGVEGRIEDFSCVEIPMGEQSACVLGMDFDKIEERVIAQIVDDATASERIRETLVIGGNRYGNRTAILATALTMTAGTRSFFDAPPTTWGGFCEPIPAYEPPKSDVAWPTKVYSNNADPFSRHIDGRHPTKARKARKKKSKK